MAKKLKFGKIRVYFRDGKTDVIPKKLWDDYEYNSTFFSHVMNKQRDEESD